MVKLVLILQQCLQACISMDNNSNKLYRFQLFIFITSLRGNILMDVPHFNLKILFRNDDYWHQGGGYLQIRVYFIIIKVSSIGTHMLIQGRLQRTETNVMHFKWEMIQTHGNQPNTFLKRAACDYLLRIIN